jgi:signal transduction histidine kinase
MSGTAVVRTRSIRVALAATLVVAVVYAAIAGAVVLFATRDLTAMVDQRLAGALDRVPPDGFGGGFPSNEGGSRPDRDPGRPYGAPFLLWVVRTDGTTVAPANSPALPAGLEWVTGPVDATIDGTPMRIAGTDVTGGRLIVAQAVDQVADTQRTIILGTLLIAPFLLGSVFIGAVIVGRRVAEPIEAARRRQLEFTTDASHELRTPLAVIEANTSLALAADREAEWYRTAFGRVDRESKRMRRLLEDMLWLARFDAAAAPAATEPVDLGLLVTQAADRFAAVAETRRLRLVVDAPATPVLVTAPADLVDRLVGVLVDNACKYAPEEGSVTVAVAADGNRATLTVDDSGPGIPDGELERVFDRFHRSVSTSSEAGGAGLGLAIGDAIVQATGGRWSVGRAPIGGARFSVSWPRTTLG